jgi:hypothetical protein
VLAACCLLHITLTCQSSRHSQQPHPAAACKVLSLAQVRTLIQREMGAALKQYDLLLCPAAPTPAYKIGSKVSDPLAMYKGEAAGRALLWGKEGTFFRPGLALQDAGACLHCLGTTGHSLVPGRMTASIAVFCSAAQGRASSTLSHPAMHGMSAAQRHVAVGKQSLLPLWHSLLAAPKPSAAPVA